MNNLSDEREQLNKIRQRWELTPYRPPFKTCKDDVSFLLSLIDSKAAEGDYEQLAHEIISEYKNGDDPGLLRSKVAEGFAQVADSAASAMRDKCVEAVTALRATPHGAAYGNAINDAVHKIESLTLDQAQENQ